MTLPGTRDNLKNLKDISILITCFNKISYIEACFKNLEPYKNFITEIIIIDDGSTDGSTSVIKKISTENSHIKFFSTKNQGSAAARNLALSKATKEFVLFLDMDDKLFFDNINIGLDLLKNSNCIAAMYNYVEKPSGWIGRTIIDLKIPEAREMKDVRNELMLNLGYWRFLYRKSAINDYQIRFLPSFLDLNGKYFILDDIFWLIYFFSIDAKIICLPPENVIYEYQTEGLKDSNSKNRYFNQIVLLPNAVAIFLKYLESNEHSIDYEWAKDKAHQIMWGNFRYLGIWKFIKTFYGLFKLYKNSKSLSLFDKSFIKNVLLTLTVTSRNSLSRISALKMLWLKVRSIFG
jgi:glycosyltransferase involved in cell wall biosynthesis